MPDNGIYVGEIVNGLKNGKGKEYDEEKALLFEGEYLKDLRHGKGKDIIIMVRFILKENIYMTEYGILKNMIWIIMLYMN